MVFKELIQPAFLKILVKLCCRDIKPDLSVHHKFSTGGENTSKGIKIILGEAKKPYSCHI